MSLRAKLSPSERELLVRPQRKTLIEAQSIIAQAKQPTDPVADTPPASQADPVADTPSAETTKNVLTTTQWLSTISIVVSVAGLYYKREEIKNLLVKKADLPPRAPPPLTRAPPVIREMD